jgi:hypothetical protein
MIYCSVLMMESSNLRLNNVKYAVPVFISQAIIVPHVKDVSRILIIIATTLTIASEARIIKIFLEC